MPPGLPSLRAVGLVLMVALAIEVVVALLMPAVGPSPLSGWGALPVLLIEVGAFLLPPLAAAKAEGDAFVATFRLRPPPWRFTAPVVLAAPALSLVLVYLQEYWAELWKPIFPMEASTALTEALTVDSAWLVLFLIVLVGIVPAICEEVFFRGFVLSGLLPRLRRSQAVMATALLFAGMHFDFYGLPTYLVLGVWFGILAVLSGSLFWPIIAHLLHNGLEVVATNYLTGPSFDEYGSWVPLVAGGVLALLALWLRAELWPRRR